MRRLNIGLLVLLVLVVAFPFAYPISRTLFLGTPDPDDNPVSPAPIAAPADFVTSGSSTDRLVAIPKPEWDLTKIRHEFSDAPTTAKPRWLAPQQWTQRISEQGVDRVISDLKELRERTSADALRRALEQAAHILRSHPAQAWFQVYCRTRYVKDSEIDRLLGGPPTSIHYLPRFVSFDQIDSPLMKTLFHQNGNHDIAISPDSETIVTDGGHDFVFWDVSTGISTKRIASGAGDSKYKRDILRVAWSPDGRYLAGGALFPLRHLVVWDLAAGEQVPLPEEPTCCAFETAFSSDSRQLIALGRTGNGPYRTYAVAYDLNTKSGRELTELDGTIVTKVCHIEDQQLLVFGTTTGLSTYDLKTSETQEVAELSNELNCVVYSPAARLVATTAFSDSEIQLWNPQGFQSVGVLDAKPLSRPRAIAFSPSGEELASIDASGEVVAWDVSSRDSRAVGRHGVGGLSIEFTGDGKHLLTAAEDHRVKVWDPSAPSSNAQHWSREVATVARLSPDNRLLATGGNDGLVRIWDVTSGEGIFTIERSAQSEIEPILDLAFSPDSTELCIAGFGKTIDVWDISKLELKKRITVGSTVFDRFQVPRVSKVLYSADGKSLFTAEGGIPRRYLVATGEMKAEYTTSRNSESNTRSITVAGDGSLLASLHSSEIRLWDPETGQRKGAIKIKRNWEPLESCDLQFSADGQTITACTSGEVESWSVATGRLLHRMPADAMDVSLDGRRMVTACDDGMVRLWDVQTKEELSSLSVGEMIGSVSLSNDGALLVVEADGTVHVFDAVVSESD